MLVVGAAQAAVITVAFVNGQVSTTSNFTTATTSTVNLAQNVDAAVGQYFRFGFRVQVTGNANPEFGTAYADAAAAAYGVTYPANLGFALIAGKVDSSDTAGTSVAPLINATTGKTRATIGTGLTWSGPGDLGDVTGGIAGSPAAIGRSSAPFDPTGVGSVAALGNVSSQWLFFTLPYQILGTGPVFLTPRLTTDSLLWHETVAGVDDGQGGITSDADFAGVGIGGGDTVVYPAAPAGTGAQLGQIVLNLPEPTSMGLLGLALVGLMARRRVA